MRGGSMGRVTHAGCIRAVQSQKGSMAVLAPLWLPETTRRGLKPQDLLAGLVQKADGKLGR